MRTASMVMGIVGGSIAILVSILLIFGSIAFFNFNSWGYDDDYDSNMNSFDNFDKWNRFDDFDFDEESDVNNMVQHNVPNVVGTIFLIPAICAALAGIMGLVSGIIVKKKHTASGVMMIVAAALSLFSFFNIVSMILFVLGAVFALMRERQPVLPYPPNYAYPQPPYPQASVPQAPQPPAPPEDSPEPPQP